MRPNIRVEIMNIPNNVIENMEVDENEEGEISDTEELQIPTNVESVSQQSPIKKIFSNIKSSEEKLQERAKRFALNPLEIRNFTDTDLLHLYRSLGITSANLPNVRFEAIHVRGVENMNSADISRYFVEYAPLSIEWVDQNSCNVVWSNKVLASRALHFLSKAVKGMPVRDDRDYFDYLNVTADGEEDTIMNRNREVHLKESSEEESDDHNAVDILEIPNNIPQGYWRLGKKHMKSDCLLMRFAMKHDKKCFKIEQLTKRTFTSSDKGDENTSIFKRNKEYSNKNEKNPWSTLARNWDEDLQYREQDRPKEGMIKVETKLQGFNERLGVTKETKKIDLMGKKANTKIPRMRMYADEEEEKMKKKQMLLKINHQIKQIDRDVSANSDLRSLLNISHLTHGIKQENQQLDLCDLGNKLKNRNQRMIFHIKTESSRKKEQPSSSRDRPEKSKTASSSNYTYKHESTSEIQGKISNFDRLHTNIRGKPKSKVQVVIKTQKRPAVPSSVAPMQMADDSKLSDESDSKSETSDSAPSESEINNDFVRPDRVPDRPGFISDPKSSKSTYKSPLKIEINNDLYKSF